MARHFYTRRNSTPNSTVLGPRNNAVVKLNQPFQISGQATDRGMPEPIMIDSVTEKPDLTYSRGQTASRFTISESLGER
jgi:hypothetical protein